MALKTYGGQACTLALVEASLQASGMEMILTLWDEGLKTANSLSFQHCIDFLQSICALHIVQDNLAYWGYVSFLSCLGDADGSYTEGAREMA